MRYAYLSVCLSVYGKTLLLCIQLQEVLLSYIANPQLELALVMLIVPFIVNVSAPPHSPHSGRQSVLSLLGSTLTQRCFALCCPLQSIMFWVVDSLMMRKYKTAKGLDHSCEGDSVKKGDSLPWTNGSEESRVRTLTLI